MSVHTKSNVSIESIQFIDSENIPTSSNEFKRKNPDTKTESNNKKKHTKKCYGFRESSAFIYRTKCLCTWKTPWIVVLISVVQVFKRNPSEKFNFVTEFNLHHMELMINCF